MRRFSIPVFAALALVVSASVAPVSAGNPADLFPEDCLVFVGAPGSLAMKDKLATTPFGKMLAHPRMKRLEAKLTDVMGKMQDLAGGEMPSEFVDGYLLVNRICTERSVGFGLMDVDVTPGAESAQAALVIDAGPDADALLSMADQVLDAMQIDTPAIEISGHAFRRFMVPDAPFEITYGLVGQTFIAGLGVESVSRVIVRLPGQGAKPLSGSKAFAGARARLLEGGDQNYSSFYINTPRVFELAKRVLGREDVDAPPELYEVFSAAGIDRLGPIASLGGIAQGGFQSGMYMPIAGLTPAKTRVTDAELKLIPRDTLFFSSEEFDLLEAYNWVIDTAHAVVGEEEWPRIEQQIGGAEAMLGTSFKDLFKGIGKRWVMFEDPGMRGILPGLVLALRPENSQPIKNAVASICALAGLAAGQEGIRVQIRNTKCGDHDIGYVHIAGAPVPVAPAWVEVGDHMMFALHPANLEETILRLEQGGESILDNPGFVAQRKRLPKDICSIAYFDSPRLISYLYPSLVPLAQAGCAMATEIGVDIDASYIPSSRFFAQFLQPQVMGTVREEGGVWALSQSSTPVSTGVLVAAAAIGAGVGVTMPAVMQARQKAESLRALNDVRMIGALAIAYANDHEDVLPEDFEALAAHAQMASHDTRAAFQRYESEYQMRSERTTTSAPPRTPFVWERRPDSDGSVAVAFVTGEAVRMDIEELHELLQEYRDK